MFFCKEIYVEYVHGGPARAPPTGYLLWETTPPPEKEDIRATVILYCSVGKPLLHHNDRVDIWKQSEYEPFSFFVRIYEAFSTGSGSGGEWGGGVNYDLKCFAHFCCCFRFLLCLFAIISSSEKSHLCHHGGSKLVKFPQCAALVVLIGGRVRCGRELLFSFTTFYLNLRIYLRKTIGSDEPSWAEPTVSIALELRRIIYIFLFFCD